MTGQDRSRLVWSASLFADEQFVADAVVASRILRDAAAALETSASYNVPQRKDHHVEALRAAALQPSSPLALVRALVTSPSLPGGEVVAAALSARLHNVTGNDAIRATAQRFAVRAVVNPTAPRSWKGVAPLLTRMSDDMYGAFCSAALALADNDFPSAASLVAELEQAERGGQLDPLGDLAEPLWSLIDSCRRAEAVSDRGVEGVDADVGPFDIVWSVCTGGITVPGGTGPLDALSAVDPRFGAAATIAAWLVRGVAAVFSVWGHEPAVVLHLGDPESRLLARAVSSRIGAPLGRFTGSESGGVVVVYDLDTAGGSDLEALRLNRHLLVAARTRPDLPADITLGPDPHPSATGLPWLPAQLWPAARTTGCLDARSQRDLLTRIDALVPEPPELRPAVEYERYARQRQYLASLDGDETPEWPWPLGPDDLPLPPANRRALWLAMQPHCQKSEPASRRRPPVPLQVRTDRWPRWPA